MKVENTYLKKGVDKKKYDRVAEIYDLFEFPMEVLAFSEWRKMLFNKVSGKLILEVGIGTGKNIPYHNENFIGLDISRRMLERANERLKKTRKRAELIQGDVEFLPFKDNTFDAVVSTYVFCSVEDPIRGLKEVYRVLKPNGNAYFLEHMRCENEIGGKILDILNPVVSIFGPEINRRTVENIKKVGFKIVEERWLMTSIFRLIVATKCS